LKNEILNLWQANYTADEICDYLGCSHGLVFKHLRNARAAGDQRAANRTYRAPARAKTNKIMILARLNAKTDFIASMVGVSRRMVQIRLKELA
jgi:predicted transcriptional regulator